MIRRPLSEETKEKISKALVGRKRPDITGANNYLWKGEEASYTSKHDQARKYWSKDACEHCGKTTTLQMANISGEYLRDSSDYLTLCAKCHFAFDDTAAHIREYYPLGASKWRGVKKASHSWMARITIDYYEVYLGCFQDIETAIMIRLSAEEQLIN